MYTIKTEEQEYLINFDKKKSNSGFINNQEFELDIVQLKENYFHIIQNGQSFSVYIIEQNPEDKSVKLQVNGQIYKLTAISELDKLLKKLGMDSTNNSKVNELKAPMPGLVLEIAVTIGQEVKKGDQLLVLEAMKMENNIKSPTDGIIKKIRIEKEKAVEKNEVLIDFE